MTGTQMNTPYLQYKDYMTERCGAPLFRVPIDFGFGCPNRAADGSGGCSFCNERGARAVQTLGRETIEAQMHDAIRFARERYGAKKFMAYIQAFTAGFGAEHQALYRAVLEAFDFSAVSFGTRPDCLTPQAFDYLSELNRTLETWVELGVQTVHDETLRRINRGHGWRVSEEAILRLHSRGIRVIVHVILGLPGETPDHFRRTAETLAALPMDAVKIHNLHIVKGTALADQYADLIGQGFQPMMEHEFAEHLMDFIRRMPPHIPILRITTDTPEEELIAPKWHMAKGQFIDYVNQQMICREWRQGDLFGNGHSDVTAESDELQPVETGDGSMTFWNEAYREHYHSPAGARLEAEQKYIVPARLQERLAAGPVRLLDVCFGLGYNSLTALNTVEQVCTGQAAPGASPALSITALEMDRRVVGAASKRLHAAPGDTFDWRRALADLHGHATCRLPHAACRILWGDARYTVTLLEPAAYDIVFLDAFSTQRNSELWTVDFFIKLRRVMKPDAVLLTYCAALPVRAGLMEAGFCAGETLPVGRQRAGTIAAIRPEDIVIPLAEAELRTMRETTRGLSYRDPYGVRTNKEILRDRQERILVAKGITAV